VRAIHTLRTVQNPLPTAENVEGGIHNTCTSSLEPCSALTSRERQVLALVAAGQNVPQIAARLSIGRRTVETHLNNVLRKLSLRTRADLIRYAVVHKMIPAD